MKIRKAVITAAGPSQRSLPLQTLIDRDGVEKPVLRIIVEEALRAGIEEIAIVVSPGDEVPYARVAGDHAGPPALRPAARAAGLRPRRSVRPRFRRPGPVSAPGRRSSLHQPNRERLRPATGRSRRGPGLCRLGRAGHPRKPLAALRRGRAASAWPAARIFTASTPSSKSPRPPKPNSAWSCPACAPDIIFASSACTSSRPP